MALRETAAEAARAQQRENELTLLEGLARLRQLGPSLDNLSPLLPSFLHFEGKPFTLERHPQFEAFYKTESPPRFMAKTARQTGKTLNSGSRAVVLANCVQDYRMLFVSPLSDQARRFSTDHVQRMIDASPLRSLWVVPRCDRGVWRKSFASRSVMHFSFAGQSVDRIRGFTGIHECDLDEIQDIPYDNVAVIRETMSAREQPVMRFTGTPKTLDNTIESLWQESSQAEWVVTCPACRFENFASIDMHLERMIGPWREDISPERPGLVCASPRCGRPLQPWLGRWQHRHPKKASEFPGYHIPQPVMSIHCCFPNKWAELLSKRDGNGGYSRQRYLNEVLGESAGTGIQLVSREELQGAAVLDWENDPANPRAVLGRLARYQLRCLAIDWGGGGESGMSMTVVALIGMTSAGKLDVIWAKRLTNPGPSEQTDEILELFKLFQAHYIAHDYTGAGGLREVLLWQRGIPFRRLIPVQYGSLAGMPFVKVKKPTPTRPRRYYLIDKTKSLQIVCHAIRTRYIRFFKYDFKSVHNRGLIEDFLALQENLVDSNRGMPIYTIVRNPAMPDDFAQAINIGAVGLWQATNRFPDFAKLEGLQRVLALLRTADGDVDSDVLEERLGLEDVTDDDLVP